MRITIRYSTLFIAFLLLSLFSYSQNEITEFGNFTAAEINMNQCPFDKEADAVVLLDKAKAYYNDHYNLVTERRIRLKILKEHGIERGDIHIRYYSDEDFESIRGIEATVLNFDNQQNDVWSKLDPKSIYNKKLNKYYSEISFALPNIKVGSIVEYRYESDMKSYGGLREWIFQKDLPVVRSSYDLVIVPNSEFAYSVYKSHDLPIVVKPDKNNGSILFEMNNLPGLREEAFMGAARDYLQRVNFQFSGYKRSEGDGYSMHSSYSTKYATTWKELADELMTHADFGNQINKNLPGAETLVAGWVKETDLFTRMKSIHEYVRSRFTWNNIYSKFADGGIKASWDKQTGNAGDINLILINLLKAANLQVKPLLVSDRDYGKIDTTYPYMDQFNKVAAYVTIDDKHYILDATDRETPSFMVPFDLLNTTGYIVDKKAGGLVKITDETRKNLNLVNITGNISESGVAETKLTVRNYDYSKIEKKEKYKNNSEKYKKEFFSSFALASLDSFAVTGADSDSLPLQHDAQISYQLNKAGDYFLINCNMFSGLDKNPFITEQRFTDINFGCKYSYTINESFNLPKNLVPETLPKTLRLVTPDKMMAITRQVQQFDDIVVVGIKVDIYKTEYTADDYYAVQGFYKQMIELLNEPVVLKEK